MPIGDVCNPINVVLEDSTTCASKGFVLKESNTAGRVEKTAAITDVPRFVSADESERDSSGLVSTAGDCAVYPLSGVRYILTEAVQWRVGDSAYLGATDGYITNADGGSAKVVGYYAGQDMSAAATAGDLVAINCSAATSAV